MKTVPVGNQLVTWLARWLTKQVCDYVRLHLRVSSLGSHVVKLANKAHFLTIWIHFVGI